MTLIDSEKALIKFNSQSQYKNNSQKTGNRRELPQFDAVLKEKKI